MNWIIAITAAVHYLMISVISHRWKITWMVWIVYCFYGFYTAYIYKNISNLQKRKKRRKIWSIIHNLRQA